MSALAFCMSPSKEQVEKYYRKLNQTIKEEQCDGGRVVKWQSLEKSTPLKDTEYQSWVDPDFQ